jgi:hypothetical protein
MVTLNMEDNLSKTRNVYALPHELLYELPRFGQVAYESLTFPCADYDPEELNFVK